MTELNKPVTRSLTLEEASRPINVNDVVLSLGTFLMFNGNGIHEEDKVAILNLDPGDEITLKMDREIEFTVSRID